MDMSSAIELFGQVAVIAVPIGVAFEIGNLLVGTFFRVAFGGRLRFSR